MHVGEQAEADEAVRTLDCECEFLKAALTVVELSHDAT